MYVQETLNYASRLTLWISVLLGREVRFKKFKKLCNYSCTCIYLPYYFIKLLQKDLINLSLHVTGLALASYGQG